MDVSFDNILEHIIPMNGFQLNWRFADEKYDNLPELHLEQLKPFDKQASVFLSEYIDNSGLHNDIPFKKGFFKTIDKIEILENNQSKIRKWLYQRGLPFDKNVYVCWDKENTLLVPWKILIKYFDSFYCSSLDYLTIFDESLDWAILFFHEDEIYFGTNKKNDI